MKKYFSIPLFSLAILTACESSDSNKPKTRADRVANICETACSKDEDLCEEKGSTKASEKTCPERCKEQVETTLKNVSPKAKEGEESEVLEACHDALFALFECSAALDCKDSQEVDEEGNSVHCTSEEKLIIKKCAHDHADDE